MAFPDLCKKRIPLFLLVLSLTSCRSAITLSSTKNNIRNTLLKEGGVFAVAFKDPVTGKEILINADEEFHAASTMKTPVLVEVFKQAAAGKLSLNDSILIINNFTSIVDGSKYHLEMSGDSEKKLYESVGQKKILDSLVYAMITVSSNLATNIIIEKVGAKNVTNTMRELGARVIQVRRGVEDSLAFALGLNNTTTARDLMILFEKITDGSAVDQLSSKAMIDILLHQTFNEIIPARLPAGVKVAHKTGSFSGVHHDSGIVFLPDGRKYILVILSKGLVDEKSATKAMASVSEQVYNYFVLAK